MCLRIFFNKKAFLDYENIDEKIRKFDIFGIFGQKFKKFFMFLFFGKDGQENVFDDVLERKHYENIDLQKTSSWVCITVSNSPNSSPYLLYNT